MKPTELRVGNLIQFEDGTIVRCTGIHPSGNYFHNGKQWIEVFRYEPIPITGEWLVKFGFYDCGGGLFYAEKWRQMLHPIQFEVQIEQMWVSWAGQVYKKAYCYHTLPEYVHQFQNFCFALTGEEL